MTPKRKLEIMANKLWITASFERYGNMCLVCGNKAETFHHFIPRSLSLALRYDIQNAVPLCSRYGEKCHHKIHFSYDPTERHRITDTIIKARGDAWYDYIQENRRKSVKNNVSWLKDRIKELEGFIENGVF